MAAAMVERAPRELPVAQLQQGLGRAVSPRPAAAPLVERPASPRQAITVLFERVGEAPDGAGRVVTSTVLAPDTSVEQIKLTGPHRGWFRSDDRLVLGGRELLEHELIGQLPTAGEGNVLHVYVKLSDLTSMSVATAAGQRFTYTNPRTPPPQQPRVSALTASLASASLAAGAGDEAGDGQGHQRSGSLVVRGQVLDSDAPLEPHITRGDYGGVVHLVIRRPKVAYTSSRDAFELTVSSSDTAACVRQLLEARQGLPADSHTLVWRGRPLPASSSLAAAGVRRGGVLELVPIEPLPPRRMPSGSPLLSSPQHDLYEGWLKARQGLASGRSPRLAPAGTGGSYFISDAEGNPVAVFKPEDEEPLARNNPKGHSGSYNGEGFRRGVLPGEGAAREVAAFLLDHGHFSGVPPTALVSCQEVAAALPEAAVREAKIGSLQAFVAADGDCEERGCGVFDTEQVHRVAVLDIRLANCDRNAGNILLRRVQAGAQCLWELVPIDHGYCLPASLSDVSFDWQFWPQAEQPFSDRTKAYIASLDAEKDGATLAAHGLSLRPECDRIRKVCTLLLQKAAARDLTPAAIAGVMVRAGSCKSPLEKLHSRALAACRAPASATGTDEAAYLRCMAESLDEFLDQLALEQLAAGQAS